MQRPSTPSTTRGLTARQLVVLQELAAGASYHHIARRIGFSVSTVRNEAVAIYRTLGVQGRVEAAARATELGLDLTAADVGRLAS